MGFIITGIIFFNRNLRVEKHLAYIAGAFLLIEGLQAFIFGKFDPVTFSGTYVRILFGYFTARILGRYFIDYYFRIVYVLAVISMVFYLPSLLSDSFFDFFAKSVAPDFVSPFVSENSFYSAPPNIIVYCFHNSLIESGRNSGPFWEPGAFSIFLVLAILFRLIQRRQIFERKLIFLYIVVITTFSTAGIISLLLLLISFYLTSRKSKGINYFFAALLTVGGVLIYSNVSFLGEKAETDISMAETTTSSRFGSALADLRDFARNPVTGWGRGENRYGGKRVAFFSAEQHRNNGVTHLLASYGIFIFLLYFYRYYTNLANLCRHYLVNTRFALFALFVILLLGFSQGIFTRPFFYALLFVGLPFVYLPKARPKVPRSVLTPKPVV